MAGHIEKHPSDAKKHVLVFEVSRTDGKRARRTHVFTGTLREAKAELARKVADADRNLLTKASGTFEEVTRGWLASHKMHVEETTYQQFELKLPRLFATFGSKRIDKITPQMIRDAYQSWMTTGRVRQGTVLADRGIGPRSVIHYHQMLRMIFTQALQDGLIARNPIDAVKPPPAPHNEMNTLTADEARELIAISEGSWLHVPIVLSIYGGLRRGEALGLRWDSVDFEAETITVRRSLAQLKGRTLLKTTKTGRERTIAMPSEAFEVLRQHKVRQASEKLAYGPGYANGGHVCAQADGKPYKPENVGVVFQTLVGKLAIGKHIRFHDLRHSHATLLNEAGVSLHTVSRRLGHSNIGTTANIYTHFSPTKDREASDAIGKLTKRKASN